MKQSDLLNLEFEMNNKSNGLGAKYQIGTQLTKGVKLAMAATYDFATQGGAVGTINLKDSTGATAILPKGALLLDSYIDVLTAPTSGGAATIAVNSGQSAGDIKAAAAIAGYTGIVAGLQQGASVNAVKATADGVVSITIATAALTAGKMNVLLEYFVSL